MTAEIFRGVVLTRPGVVALLAEDGQHAIVFSGDDPDQEAWTSLLEELHRCGLRYGADVVDEWIAEADADHALWVTVFT